MTEQFDLGQKVTFSHPLHRESVYEKSEFGRDEWWKKWLEPESSAPMTGVVVGVRHLSNGVNHGGYWDSPIEYHNRETFKAYLIAYDMREKPVYVLPERVQGVDG
jgi:hypothetical protein